MNQRIVLPIKKKITKRHMKLKLLLKNRQRNFLLSLTHNVFYLSLSITEWRMNWFDLEFTLHFFSLTLFDFRSNIHNKRRYLNVQWGENIFQRKFLIWTGAHKNCNNSYQYLKHFFSRFTMMFCYIIWCKKKLGK